MKNDNLIQGIRTGHIIVVIILLLACVVDLIVESNFVHNFTHGILLYCFILAECYIYLLERKEK